MQDLKNMLQNCKLFSGMPEVMLQETVLPQGRLREYTRQTTIISPQENVSWFGIIVSGRIQIAQIFSDGCSSLMGTLNPGALLGVDLICTRSRRAPYHAIAASNTEIFCFPADMVLEPGQLPERERLDVLRIFMTLLSHENMRKHYRIAILSQRGLRDRILIYLTMQAGRRGSDSFQIPFSREELADYLCVNRSALSHELSLMEQEGLIRFQKTILHFSRRECATASGNLRSGEQKSR